MPTTLLQGCYPFIHHQMGRDHLATCIKCTLCQTPTSVFIMHFLKFFGKPTCYYSVHILPRLELPTAYSQPCL